MEPKYVVVSIAERLADWRETDDAAKAAERDLARAGQGAGDPAYRELALRAKRLREEADRKFAAITRAVRMDSTGEGVDGTH